MPAPLPALECEPSFQSRPQFQVGPNSGASALADLDGDGKLDLTTGSVYFLGDGAGGFGRAVNLLPPGEKRGGFDVAARDFDRDGRLDLAITSFFRDQILILFGREPESPSDALFETPLVVRLPTPVWHLVSADFNSDELPDVAAVGAPAEGGGSIPVLLASSGRNFRVRAEGPDRTAGHGVATGDFDGDGDFDIAFGSGNEVALSPGDGRGSFAPGVKSTLFAGASTVSAHRFRAADLDGDGRSDLLAIGGNWVLVYLGRDIDPQEGLPRIPSHSLELGGNGRFLEIDDMNGDGVLDLVAEAAARTAVLQVFYGEREEASGTLSFTAGERITTGLSGRGSVLAVGDLDGDRAVDIVLTTEDTGLGQVFLNDASCSPVTVPPGDANADGKVNINDPITTLGFLFLGQSLPCPTAADVDNNGALNITDPVYLLGYLFLGGPPPANPGPHICP